MRNLYLIAVMSLFTLSACKERHEPLSYAGAVEIECRRTFPSERANTDHCGCMFIHLTSFTQGNRDLGQVMDLAVEKAGQNAGSARILEFVPTDTRDKLLKEENYIRGTLCASQKP
jgi:hypothetical protein